MSAGKDFIPSLNDLFKLFGSPLQILEIFCYRRFLRNSLFQDYEPIHDVQRLLECDPVYIMLLLEFQGRQYEYEVKYNNDNKMLKLNSFRLNYCQYTPEEDVTKIEDNMKPLVSMLAIALPAIFTFGVITQKEEE